MRGTVFPALPDISNPQTEFYKSNIDYSAYSRIIVDRAKLSYKNEPLLTNSSLTKGASASHFKLPDADRDSLLALIEKTFEQTFAASTSYSINAESDSQALRLSPAMSELSVNIPPRYSTRGADGVFFTETIAEMFLICEIRDDKSGELLARIVEPAVLSGEGFRAVRDSPLHGYEMKAVIRQWAHLVAELLEEIP